MKSTYLQCTFAGCQCELKDEQELLEHVKNTHLNKRPFGCKHCNRKFKTFDDLKYHIMLKHKVDEKQKKVSPEKIKRNIYGREIPQIPVKTVSTVEENFNSIFSSPEKSKKNSETSKASNSSNTNTSVERPPAFVVGSDGSKLYVNDKILAIYDGDKKEYPALVKNIRRGGKRCTVFYINDEFEKSQSIKTIRKFDAAEYSKIKNSRDTSSDDESLEAIEDVFDKVIKSSREGNSPVVRRSTRKCLNEHVKDKQVVEAILQDQFVEKTKPRFGFEPKPPKEGSFKVKSKAEARKTSSKKADPSEKEVNRSSNETLTEESKPRRRKLIKSPPPNYSESERDPKKPIQTEKTPPTKRIIKKKMNTKPQDSDKSNSDTLKNNSTMQTSMRSLENKLDKLTNSLIVVLKNNKTASNRIKKRRKKDKDYIKKAVKKLQLEL